jgi:hypothetical protein
MAAGTRMHKSKKDRRTWQLLEANVHGEVPQREGLTSTQAWENNSYVRVVIS